MEKDSKRAAFYYKIAAERGQTRSWANLYQMHSNGAVFEDKWKARLYHATTKDTMPIGF